MLYQFKIQIKEIAKPPVWRKLIVPANYSFHNFHIAIQVAFGWDNSHLYEFSPNGYGSYPSIKEPSEDNEDYGETLDSDETKLLEIFTKEKQKFTYIYDFGDDWIHSIVLEEILPNIEMYPRLLAGKGKCPPEDCGGIWGYEKLKETLSNIDHPEYKEMSEWYGLENNELWDATIFNIKETRKRIMEVFATGI